jgi:hypothetical protein
VVATVGDDGGVTVGGGGGGSGSRDHSSATTGSGGGGWCGGVVEGSGGGVDLCIFSCIFQKCLPCAEEDARQRKKFRFSALRISLPCAVFDARQRTIAVRVLENARQSPFTVQNAAVCALP